VTGHLLADGESPPCSFSPRTFINNLCCLDRERAWQQCLNISYNFSMSNNIVPTLIAIQEYFPVNLRISKLVIDEIL